MQDRILFIATLIIANIFSTRTYAQLKVEYSGCIKAENKLSVVPNDFSVSDTAAYITSTAAFTKSAYGIFSKTWYRKNPAGPNYNFGNKIIGIYGNAEDNLIPLNHTSTPPFNAGVAGTSDKGVGVYGAVTDTFPRFNPGQYAGYFMGNTKVIGVLTCTSLTQTSDVRTKHNITYLNNSTLGNIMQLKPISFYYNQDDRIFNSAEPESPAVKQMHYGFNAQELQEVLPNVVYMGQDSILSINYIELIPLLVQAVQELSEEVAELKANKDRANF